MKISVLIPCYYKHFKNLKNIINLILKGTYQPYEIIISLNGCKFLNNDDILNFENNYKNIKLKLVKTLELLSRLDDFVLSILNQHIKNMRIKK